jgi:hypothetical protein
MKFNSESLIGGGVVHGYEEDLHWSKDKGGYHQHRDFFWVHWEIGDRAPLSVKLHVECPKVGVDPELNAIKQQMVEDFLSSRLQAVVEERGYIYKKGSRIKPEDREKFKCTAPFYVILTKEQSRNEHKANIEMVNAALGDEVRQVVQRFKPQLNHHFFG